MKIAVGLSGGVDSAVTAALLKEQGHEVIGVFMKNWSDDFGISGDCPWEQDQKDAQSVAQHLGIEFLSYNFELQYRERVIEYFFAEYKAGRTPNPDILCNSEIKFNVFLKKCLQELGADKIATGHYARVLYDTNGDPHLYKGIDNNKDQSYFLCRLTNEELNRSVFPIGEYTKPRVRELARKYGIPVAEKKDSQGICFVGKINVREFIESELGSKKGEILDIDTNEVLGEHNGLWFYTIGQREGLGLSGGPWFVVSKSLETNRVYVAKGKNNPALFKNSAILQDINVINPSLFLGYFKAEVSLRYRQKPSNASIEFTENNLVNINFNVPQRAIAPGQFGCIFMGDELIGSGVIK